MIAAPQYSNLVGFQHGLFFFSQLKCEQQRIYIKKCLKDVKPGNIIKNRLWKRINWRAMSQISILKFLNVYYYRQYGLNWTPLKFVTIYSLSSAGKILSVPEGGWHGSVLLYSSFCWRGAKTSPLACAFPKCQSTGRLDVVQGIGTSFSWIVISLVTVSHDFQNIDV